ncbi:MAG: cytidylate kinase-like family protein [Candidatus Marinimicrobia bacterium]|nr:cytidylate kinase-like family protein [Candidatus Neomarinimicrobiota bacterium]
MKTHFAIPPGIEKRLQVWTDWTERQAKQDLAPRPCITISREYGCQAYVLAETLANRLSAELEDEQEWIMLDRLLLEKVAQGSGYSKSELNYVTQIGPAFQSMMANLLGPDATKPVKAFTYIKESIQYFARAGNSIIVGRGGVCIAQNFPNTVHIRLIAPMSFKIHNIMQSMGISAVEARKHIEARQGERNKFIEHFTKMDISDPNLYHLILNNEKSSIDEMADMIIPRLKNI